MKKHLIFLFLLTSMGSFGQFTKLTLDFYPSFHDKSQVLIENVNSIYSMTIMSGKINETCYLSESSVADLEHFLADYLQKEFTEDSIETVKRLEREKRGFVVSGADGITVKGKLIVDKSEGSFDFWSPNKGTINHAFMKLIFRLMNASYRNQAANYVEQLEGYFSLGLGLKTMNQYQNRIYNYKLYGSISSNEEQELNNFFNQLTPEMEISFDMSNFNGMGTMFYPAFKSLCDRIPNIKWNSCSDRIRKQLIEAGVKESSIH